jgi:hypothetical protein
MPTQIHNPRLGARERYFARQAVSRLGNQTRQTEVVNAPWLGWVPDLPPHMVGWRGYREGRGLIAIPYQGRGMFLRHDDGYVRLDEDRMVGGTSELPAVVGPPGHPGWLDPTRAITFLGQYTDNANPPALQRIAIVAGTEAGDPGYASDILMARLSGAGQWTAVFPNVLIPVVDIPEGDRDALWDFAVYPFGCPTATRSDQAGNNAPINGPVMVLCNADGDQPVDCVLVTPSVTGGGGVPDPTEYDELQGDPAITPNPDFKAASVEAFNGRMHFLATSEGGTDHRQRHRWSAVGTASPDEAIIGAGYLDLVEFQGRGLRIESLGNKLALYFDDGVAFQTPTNFFADAYRSQVLSRTRGLMGTKALCAISPQLHFGIFTDGWWFLDASGRWREAGTLVLEETKGKSHELTKWKETFYSELDYNTKHRIVTEYDQFRKLVRIAYTTNSSAENTNILNYHWPTDTCWKDEYDGGAVSVWGSYDQQIKVGTPWGYEPVGPPITIGMGPTLQWKDVVGTWASYAPQYIDRLVVHGDVNGLVYSRDPNLTTYDGDLHLYLYQTHDQSRNENPLLGQTFHRFGVEYLNAESTALAVVASSEHSSQGQIISMSEGTAGDIQNSYAHFRVNGNQHNFLVGGYAPVAIRSFTPEMLIYGYNDRGGQT